MQRSDFFYHLPTQLIAQQPLADRSASRLLSVNGATGVYQDHCFRDVIDLVHKNDLLVFNNTQVIPARLYGQKDTGGKVEILIERLLDEHHALVHIRASRAPKIGQSLILEQALHASVLRREDSLFVLTFQHKRTLLTLLDQYGHIPLPPYIERAQDYDEKKDRQCYQTVFAQKPGAVAAPTAGLHFDQQVLEQLKSKGVQQQAITLHVGAGTFQPVRVDNLAEHNMHAEWIEVNREACDAINACRKRGGRVIAVGTTSVRSLESAAQSGALTPFNGDTRLFITPGYRFRVVDAMITNFHLPESTLLMLVSAFSGYEPIMQAYQHAIDAQYRFFSYGDAMFLTPSPDARP